MSQIGPPAKICVSAGQVDLSQCDVSHYLMEQRRPRFVSASKGVVWDIVFVL
jgi:hypothetical protein